MSQHSSSGCSSITGCIVVARPTAGPVGRGRCSPLVAFVIVPQCNKKRVTAAYRMKQWRSLTLFRRLRRCLTPYQLSKAFFRPAMIWSPFVMKCIVSSSSKRITCHIPTALGTCTTGSWWHVWAALFCPAEGSFATSSSTWEGESPFHLCCFLSFCLSWAVCCSMCLALLVWWSEPVGRWGTYLYSFNEVLCSTHKQNGHSGVADTVNWICSVFSFFAKLSTQCLQYLFLICFILQLLWNRLFTLLPNLCSASNAAFQSSPYWDKWWGRPVKSIRFLPS